MVISKHFTSFPSPPAAKIKQPKCFTAFWGNKRLHSCPLGFIIKALFHLEQAVVFVGVGHQLAPLVPVEILAF